MALSSRELVNNFFVFHSVLGFFRGIRLQQHTQHVGSLDFFCVPLYGTSCKLACTIKVCAEPVILARRKVPDILQKKIWDVSPNRLEDQVEWRGVQRGIDAAQGQETELVLLSASNDKVELTKRTTYNRPAYIFDRSVSAPSRDPKSKSKPA